MNKKRPFRTLILLLIGISVMSLNACKSDEEPTPEAPALSIGLPNGDAAPSKLELSSDGGTQKLAIASNSTWKITKQGSATDWVTISPQEGSKNGEITITVAKNTNVTDRELTLAFAVNGQENFKTYTVAQLGYGPNLSVTPETPETVSKDGSDLTFTITSNNDSWEYAAAGGPTWITQKEKTATSLTLTIAKNTSEARTSEVTFKLTNYPAITKTLSISQAGGVSVVANLLDVQFNLDGSATDLSPMKNPIIKVSFDQPFTVSLNNTYNRNMVTFNPAKNGTNPGANKGSFYRIDYLNNPGLKNKLAESHTFEALIQFEVDYNTPQAYETKFFSTHEGGGTGLMIAHSNQATGPNGITFLPNVPAAQGGASRWIWANSKVKPDGQSWYHVVGIWDKEAGKAFIYINGVKQSEVEAVGFFRHVNADAINWIAIGGDPGGDNILQGPFKGSMAIARIYDKALTTSEVDHLWNQVKP